MSNMIKKFEFKDFKNRIGKNCFCKIPHEDNICPCKEFLETGKCICGLFKDE